VLTAEAVTVTFCDSDNCLSESLSSIHIYYVVGHLYWLASPLYLAYRGGGTGS
jgi:hypothetical protein